MRNPSLRCTACAAAFDLASLVQRCPGCGEPVEVTGEVAGARPRTGASSLLERYGKFLPFASSDEELTLGEGQTPLLRSRHLEALTRVDELWLKVEGLNPTGSFKDRGTVAGVLWACERGIRRVGTVSTGNMAGSVAAYAARAGLPCTVITSPDIPAAKLGPIGVHGPRLVRLAGGYGDAYGATVRLGARNGTYFINSDDPMRVEGQKTLAFEILEQLGGNGPDLVVLPVSSGGNASALLKGLDEWRAAGLAESLPRLLCVQASGCAPIALGFAAGTGRPARVERPDTIALAISNPDPPSGARLLRALRGGERGWVVSVTDRQIEAAQALLAQEEGLFVQPDAAASLAGLTRAVRTGLVQHPRRVVLVLTGHGLKDPSVFERGAVPTRDAPASALEDLLTQTGNPMAVEASPALEPRRPMVSRLQLRSWRVGLDPGGTGVQSNHAGTRRAAAGGGNSTADSASRGPGAGGRGGYFDGSARNRGCAEG